MKFIVEIPYGEVLTAFPYPLSAIEEAIDEIAEAVNGECSFLVDAKVTVIPDQLVMDELKRSLRPGDVAKFKRLTGATSGWPTPPEDEERAA